MAAMPLDPPTEPLALVSLDRFPLHTVLLPGASLGLCVFEPRYLDLVRECSRNTDMPLPGCGLSMPSNPFSAARTAAWA